MSKQRLCCCIPDQNDLSKQCQNLAEFQIWFGHKPTPDNYTESCAEHIAQLLDDSQRFEIFRISQELT